MTLSEKQSDMLIKGNINFLVPQNGCIICIPPRLVHLLGSMCILTRPYHKLKNNKLNFMSSKRPREPYLQPPCFPLYVGGQGVLRFGVISNMLTREDK